MDPKQPQHTTPLLTGTTGNFFTTNMLSQTNLKPVCDRLDDGVTATERLRCVLHTLISGEQDSFPKGGIPLLTKLLMQHEEANRLVSTLPTTEGEEAALERCYADTEEDSYCPLPISSSYFWINSTSSNVKQAMECVTLSLL